MYAPSWANIRFIFTIIWKYFSQVDSCFFVLSSFYQFSPLASSPVCCLIEWHFHNKSLSHVCRSPRFQSKPASRRRAATPASVWRTRTVAGVSWREGRSTCRVVVFNFLKVHFYSLFIFANFLWSFFVKSPTDSRRRKCSRLGLIAAASACWCDIALTPFCVLVVCCCCCCY